MPINQANSWFRMQAQSDGAADIYIYDEIGYWGVTAKQFITDLEALGELSLINLHINSPGGDVFDGIAIFNALKHCGAAITVHVDGIAASMASYIAMVGNPVIMPENTMMMIHYHSHYLMGTHEEPDLFINSLLIMNKREMLFAFLFYCFSALQLNVYCNVYCRMRCYGWREQVK
ncbi:head maturation protease, ClpP-related [Pectobacterium brasiliense]|uniref:head maturation protease, ClpP-related n=1 Tax=Pectobacterium brasiliense TaxID=180957 RepID=UPI000CE6878A|nr:head maturation protease, ClpP-related [Pectobacterium brasiliense]